MTRKYQYIVLAISLSYNYSKKKKEKKKRINKNKTNYSWITSTQQLAWLRIELKHFLIEWPLFYIFRCKNELHNKWQSSQKFSCSFVGNNQLWWWQWQWWQLRWWQWWKRKEHIWWIVLIEKSYYEYS